MSRSGHILPCLLPTPAQCTENTTMPPPALGTVRRWERRELEFLFYYPNAGVGSVVFTVIGTFLHPYKPPNTRQRDTGHMCRGHHDTQPCALVPYWQQLLCGVNLHHPTMKAAPPTVQGGGCVVAGMDAYSDDKLNIRAGGGPGTFFSTHGNHLP